MSYVRFSSDQWRSDVYVYSADTGIAIHVAARRTVFDPAYPVPDTNFWEGLDPSDEAAWELAAADWQNRHQAAMNHMHYEDINGPLDGYTYDGLSVDEAVAKLAVIKAAGYHVPEDAFTALEADKDHAA